MCEAIGQEVNYLIDKAGAISKGANTTFSYIRHYFQKQVVGETTVQLDADNCIGHTEFALDRFELIMCAYKVNNIILLYGFARIVESASTATVNKAQLVETHNGWNCFSV